MFQKPPIRLSTPVARKISAFMATAGGRRRGMFQGPWSFNALELVRWLRGIPVGGLNELKYPPLSGPSNRAKS